MSEKVRVTYHEEGNTFLDLRNAEVAMGTVHLSRLHHGKDAQLDALKLESRVSLSGTDFNVKVDSPDIAVAHVKAVSKDRQVHTFAFDANSSEEPLVHTLTDESNPDVLLDRQVATPDQEGYALARQFNALLFEVIEQEGV